MSLFSSVFCGAGAYGGYEKKFMNNFVFPAWVSADGFNNNNYNNEYSNPKNQPIEWKKGKWKQYTRRQKRSEQLYK